MDRSILAHESSYGEAGKTCTCARISRGLHALSAMAPFRLPVRPGDVGGEPGSRLPAAGDGDPIALNRHAVVIIEREVIGPDTPPGHPISTGSWCQTTVAGSSIALHRLPDAVMSTAPLQTYCSRSDTRRGPARRPARIPTRADCHFKQSALLAAKLAHPFVFQQVQISYFKQAALCQTFASVLQRVSKNCKETKTLLP
jgi:hypothetical protein